MSLQHTRWALVVMALAMAPLGTVIPAEPTNESSEISKQQRAQMASAHEKMAACLRSDRAFDECRQEMHASCMSTFGDQGCPMMGNGMRMHDRPMKRPPPDKPDAN